MKKVFRFLAILALWFLWIWTALASNPLADLANNTASGGMATATEISNGDFWAIAKFWVGFIIFMTLIAAVIGIVKFRKG